MNLTTDYSIKEEEEEKAAPRAPNGQTKLFVELLH